MTEKCCQLGRQIQKEVGYDSSVRIQKAVYRAKQKLRNRQNDFR